MYEPVDEPDFRVGQRVIASGFEYGSSYTTTVLALRTSGNTPSVWLYEIKDHPHAADDGPVIVSENALSEPPAIDRLANLVCDAP